MAAPSSGVMMSGLDTCRMKTSHTYASTDPVAVHVYTPRESIRRSCGSGTATTQIARIISRLNAAEPTIVLGPSSPEYIWPPISITESRISGADEPSAISVRLAIVGFQTRTKYGFCTPFTVMITFFSDDVIRSIAAMKTSATIATPRKHHSSIPR